MIDIGTIVYLAWYDFVKKTEHTCKGEVVDNSLWESTQWHGFVNVRFRPPSLSGTIEHHFKEEKLSMTPNNVPHDDCYLVCGKKTRFFEHDISGKLSKVEKLNASDAWKTVQQFKQEHWDYEHGCLSVDALDEYYQLWHDAIAAKCGFAVAHPAPVTYADASRRPTPTSVVTASVPDGSPLGSTSTTPVASASGTKKPSRKELRSTGRIVFADSIQTSLFD